MYYHYCSFWKWVEIVCCCCCYKWVLQLCICLSILLSFFPSFSLSMSPHLFPSFILESSSSLHIPLRLLLHLCLLPVLSLATQLQFFSGMSLLSIFSSPHHQKNSELHKIFTSLPTSEKLVDGELVMVDGENGKFSSFKVSPSTHITTKPQTNLMNLLT